MSASPDLLPGAAVPHLQLGKGTTMGVARKDIIAEAKRHTMTTVERLSTIYLGGRSSSSTDPAGREKRIQ
jgi:hypothetical protein